MVKHLLLIQSLSNQLLPIKLVLKLASKDLLNYHLLFNFKILILKFPSLEQLSLSLMLIQTLLLLILQLLCRHILQVYFNIDQKHLSLVVLKEVIQMLRLTSLFILITPYPLMELSRLLGQVHSRWDHSHFWIAWITATHHL